MINPELMMLISIELDLLYASSLLSNYIVNFGKLLIESLQKLLKSLLNTLGNIKFRQKSAILAIDQH